MTMPSPLEKNNHHTKTSLKLLSSSLALLLASFQRNAAYVVALSMIERDAKQCTIQDHYTDEETTEQSRGGERNGRRRDQEGRLEGR